MQDQLPRAARDVSPTPLDWLVGGEMGKVVRDKDWSNTPLGPIDDWPQSLRTAVSLCLASNFPISLAWGPQRIQIYNDGYWPICGAKHPHSMGQDFKECWFSAWPAIGSAFEQATAGRAAFLENQRMFLDRNGFLEETFFTFSFSPIRDHTGAVVGLFHPVTELTQATLAERRLQVLRDIADDTAEARTTEDAARLLVSTLERHALDVPFVLLYLLDGDGRTARLVAAAGLTPGTPASPEAVEVAAPSTIWPFAAARAGQIVAVEDLEARTGDLGCGPYPESPKAAFVLPLSGAGLDHPLGLLIAGVSPRRVLDQQYRTFYSLLRDAVTTALSNARAYEEERKRAEALAEIDRAKTAFFSNVSHEFRTPLTLMLGPLADTLAEPALDGTSRERLEIAQRNSLRLLKLVNTLLDFSRIEAGRVEAVFEETDVSAVTAELASNFRSACERAGVRLVVDCQPVRAPVYLDRDMWEKIVLNLLSNAFKFTFAGEIAVGLREAGGMVHLTVRDTGTGIPAEHLPHVFERFYRVRQARGRTHEGTGIGLALVQELVRLHGGSVQVTSVPDAGTTFEVVIPIGRAHLPADRVGAARSLASTGLGVTPFVEEALRWLPDRTPGASHAEAADPRPDDGVVVHRADGGVAVRETAPAPAAGPRGRILWADDNADMRDYVCRLLAGSHDVEAVADGQAALAAATAHPPDLVLTDVMMPGLDGFQLLRALRADPATREVPVILLSARAGEESRVEGLQAGADDYLIKPFTARELLARVDAHLQLKRLREAAQQQLRESEDRYRRTMHLLPVAVYTCAAPSGVITFYNEHAATLWGRRPNVGDTDERFCGSFRLWRLDGSLLPHDQTPMAQALLEGREFRNVDVVIERPDGSRITVLVNIDPIRDATGAVVGAINAFHDITALKDAELRLRENEERLRDTDRRKDEFLAMLAHELRNPLAPIRTGLEVIRVSGDTPAAVARVRSMMERQVGHMVRLVDDLLDVSRITSGKIQLQRKPVAVADLVNNAVDANRAALAAARLELGVSIPGDDLQIDVDPTRFVQILSNVLHNATKFTPPGGRVDVAVLVAEGPGSSGDQVRFHVRDTGVGIAPETLPTIFELFTQGNQTAQRHQPGLGIGLALARQLVELHGGRIEARSEGPGLGSEFVISLPLQQRVDGRRMTAAGAEAGRVTRRVVIIDDNEDAAITLAMLIEELGGEARVAHDAASGVETFREFQPDVVLLDIGLPAVDGYEVCRRIRREPTGSDVLIVALTGRGQQRDKQEAFNVGFDAHLTKPADPAALASLLSKAAT